MRTSNDYLSAVIVLYVAGSSCLVTSANAQSQPGRQVRVAAIAIGFGGEYDKNLKLAMEHLEAAGKGGVDIACLPEQFASDKAEPISGPTTKVVGQLAKKYGMYVVCPIRELAADGCEYNTAVLLDRQGDIAGYYRKVFVFWGEGANLSREGVKVFDTDFGRIAILICFDANFDELWQEAERKGAEIVFWPSAYDGGIPLNGYAMIHNYNVVGVGRGDMIDVFGKAVTDVDKPHPGQTITTFDLDLTLIHMDFNRDKVKKLLREHAGEVEQVSVLDPEGWFVLRAIKPGVQVRELCEKYQIETLRGYRHRSREQINQRRKAGQRV